MHTPSLYSGQREVTHDFITFFQKTSVFVHTQLTLFLKIDMDSKKNVSATF